MIEGDFSFKHNEFRTNIKQGTKHKILLCNKKKLHPPESWIQVGIELNKT